MNLLRTQHGIPDVKNQCLQEVGHPRTQVADRLAMSPHGPQQSTELVPDRGPVETYLTEDVRADVTASFRVSLPLAVRVKLLNSDPVPNRAKMWVTARRSGSRSCTRTW